MLDITSPQVVVDSMFMSSSEFIEVYRHNDPTLNGLDLIQSYNHIRRTSTSYDQSLKPTPLPQGMVKNPDGTISKTSDYKTLEQIASESEAEKVDEMIGEHLDSVGQASEPPQAPVIPPTVVATEPVVESTPPAPQPVIPAPAPVAPQEPTTPVEEEHEVASTIPAMVPPDATEEVSVANSPSEEVSGPSKKEIIEGHLKDGVSVKDIVAMGYGKAYVYKIKRQMANSDGE